MFDPKIETNSGYERHSSPPNIKTLHISSFYWSLVVDHLIACYGWPKPSARSKVTKPTATIIRVDNKKYFSVEIFSSLKFYITVSEGLLTGQGWSSN